MKWNTCLIPFLCLGFLPFATCNAQVPTARTDIPLSADNKTVRITGPKNLKVENLEGGGIRISFRNDGKTRTAVEIERVFAQPLTVANMGFEYKQAQTEKLSGTGVLEDGRKLRKVLESMGPEFFPYTVDFLHEASEAKMELNAPFKTVSISFKVPPESGDLTVELKNWWVE